MAGGRVMETRATFLVVGRELREAFRRKVFWIVLAIMFAGSGVAMILPEVLDSGHPRARVAVVDGDGGQVDGFETALRAMQGGLGSDVQFTPIANAERARASVDDGSNDVAVVLANEPAVIVRAGEHDTLVAFVRQALATSAVRANLGAAGLAPRVVDGALHTAPVHVEQMAVDSSDRRASAAILSLVLYLLLLTLMIQAANGVAIEKGNRISEVLLAVVRPGSLLFGKVIGVTIVGLASLAAAAIPLLAKGIVGGDLPAGLGPAAGIGFAWMLLGLVFYLTAAGALGALIERQEEAGTVIAPLSMVLIGTYVAAQAAPGGAFGTALGVFPLSSPIIMPTRIALGVASGTEIVASLALGLLAVVFVVRIGGAIYRRGIVHTGQRLALGDALRTAGASYQ
jgi:ABC-2 type transport system permease protein